VDRVGAEQVRVAATSLAEAEAGLAPVLAGAGARIVSVMPAAGELEHVFLQLLAEPGVRES
jgi:hypothetical protein